MKTLLNILVMITILVVPVLARAMPCASASASFQTIESQQADYQAQHPCPHYDTSTPGQKQGMVIADCVDFDKVLLKIDDSFKIDKLNQIIVAIMPEIDTTQVLTSNTAVRAPPSRMVDVISKQSLFLTTQRFRV